MESQFFTWDGGWDQQDLMAFTFYNCQLVRDIGSYSKGDVIPTVGIDYANGTLEFYDKEGKPTDRFELLLEVK